MIGTEEGQVCGRDGCTGVIELLPEGDGGCSCHISPPCGFCLSSMPECPECHWREGDEPEVTVIDKYQGVFVEAPPEFLELTPEMEERLNSAWRRSLSRDMAGFRPLIGIIEIGGNDQSLARPRRFGWLRRIARRLGLADDGA